MDDELFVLSYELRTDLEAYLATRTAFAEDVQAAAEGGLRGTASLPASGRVVRSLADVIAFNRRHADTELGLFGQELSFGVDEPPRTVEPFLQPVVRTVALVRRRPAPRMTPNCPP